MYQIFPYVTYEYYMRLAVFWRLLLFSVVLCNGCVPLR
jgi:hypothetical protein